jgi:hypothetical protein
LFEKNKSYVIIERKYQLPENLIKALVNDKRIKTLVKEIKII